MVVLESLGFRAGDRAHFVLGNFNLCYPAVLAVLSLGGAASVGDVNLEAKSVGEQVKRKKIKVDNSSCSEQKQNLIQNISVVQSTYCT